MKYFKNAELARLYNVSEKSVRNWIDASKQGRANLELYEQGQRIYIADTLQNEYLIDQLVARSKKYRNQLSHKILTPTPEFYSHYNPKQIADIINQLCTHHELPIQYRYVGAGAKHWDAYLTKLYYTDKANMMSATISLLGHNLSYLDSLLESYEKVNIVDLGVGNGLAVRQLLQHILKSGRLNRYIGIDSSRDLLEITKQNITQWFDNAIDIETHLLDLNYQRFTDLLQQDDQLTANVLLFTGGTVGNFRDASRALATIRDSMSPADVLITGSKLDSTRARRFFDFNTTDNHELPAHHRNQLNMLSIDGSLYEVEQSYDEPNKSRYIRIKLKYALTLVFKTGHFERTINFEKGDTISLLHFAHRSSSEMGRLYEENGFSNLVISTTSNEEYVMMVSKVKTTY